MHNHATWSHFKCMTTNFKKVLNNIIYSNSLHFSVLLDGSFIPLSSNLNSLLPTPHSQPMTLFPTSLTKLKQAEENVHRSTTTPSPPPVSSLTQLCLPTVAINDYPCAYLSLHCVLHSTSACLHKDTIPTILPSFCDVSFLVSTGSFPITDKCGIVFLILKITKLLLTSLSSLATLPFLLKRFAVKPLEKLLDSHSSLHSFLNISSCYPTSPAELHLSESPVTATLLNPMAKKKKKIQVSK